MPNTQAQMNALQALYLRTREDVFQAFVHGHGIGNLPTLGEKYGAAIVRTASGASHVPVT